VAAAVRLAATFARAGAAVFLAAFGAEGLLAAAFRGAAARGVAFFATALGAGAGAFTPPAVDFFLVAAAAFFTPRALPGDGADLSRAPAFFLLLAIGGQYTTRRACATRACPAARPAAGPAADAPGS